MGSLIATLIFKTRRVLRGVPRRVPFRSSSHSERLFHGFVRLLDRGCGQRRRIRFCTGRLYVSSGCLARVAHHAVKRAPGRVVSDHLLLRTVGLLRGGGSDVRSVDEGLNFPSRSCFKHFFGQVGRVSPRRCQLSPGD